MKGSATFTTVMSRTSMNWTSPRFAERLPAAWVSLDGCCGAHAATHPCLDPITFCIKSQYDRAHWRVKPKARDGTPQTGGRVAARGNGMLRWIGGVHLRWQVRAIIKT